MHCTNCGAALADGSRFCPACGAPVSAKAPNQPVQTARQPVDAAQPQYAPQPQVIVVTKPEQPPRPPKAPSNGPAVAGLVFNCIVLTLLLFSLAGVGSGSYDGVAAAAIFVIIALILFLFAVIFGIIGFVKGLKHKVRMVVGIIAFVLIFVNAAIIVNAVGALAYLP